MQYRECVTLGCILSEAQRSQRSSEGSPPHTAPSPRSVQCAAGFFGRSALSPVPAAMVQAE